MFLHMDLDATRNNGLFNLNNWIRSETKESNNAICMTTKCGWYLIR
jgi:hypothetical protein